MSCYKFNNNYLGNKLYNKELYLSHKNSSNYYIRGYWLDNYIYYPEHCSFFYILNIYQVRCTKCSFIFNMGHIYFNLGIKLSEMGTSICYQLLKMFQGKNKHCLLIKWNCLHTLYIYLLQNIECTGLWCIPHKASHLLPFYWMGIRINLLHLHYMYQGSHICHWN